MVANSYLSNIQKLPVAINNYFGDPFQKNQWIDTIDKLVQLQDSNHKGEVCLITKVLFTKAQIDLIKKINPNVWIFFSITGLKEYELLKIENIEKMYLYACENLANVVCYIRPIIPNQNDNIEVIGKILKIAQKGNKLAVVGGYKDIGNINESDNYSNIELDAQIQEYSKMLGVKVFNKTSCCVSAVTNQHCATHANILMPKNIELIKSLGYPISIEEKNITLSENYGWTKGDYNLIRMLSQKQPVLDFSKINQTRFLSIKSITNSPLVCTSSWFCWVRQTKSCVPDCWYCSARNNNDYDFIKNFGCNPINLLQ